MPQKNYSTHDCCGGVLPGYCRHFSSSNGMLISIFAGAPPEKSAKMQGEKWTGLHSVVASVVGSGLGASVGTMGASVGTTGHQWARRGIRKVPKCNIIRKEASTRSSQRIPVASTNQASPCLDSEVGRDLSCTW